MDIQGMIQNAVQDKIVAEISKKTWLQWETAQKAIKAALPMLMGAMSKNADTQEWKDALDSALDAHDETNVLNETEWEKMLWHILWDEESAVEEAVAAQAWVSKEEATSVTKMIAPFLMGQLGSAKKAGADVAGDLNKDTIAKSLLTSFLDKDWDGDVKDDLLWMGMDYFKKKMM